jgi:UMF1 family MFS transporter
VTLGLGTWQWQASALSLWGYTVSASLLVVLVLSPFLGAWADAGAHRKKVFSAFTFLGIMGTTGLFLFDEWTWALSSFVIANIGFSGANIFCNSLLSSVADEKDWHSLSLKGFGWGYLGGGVLLAINLLLISKFEFFGFDSKKEAVEACFASVAGWWFVFSLPALFFISEKKSHQRLDFALGLRAVRHFGSSLKQVFRTRNLLIFMVAYACFNDGIQTVIAMASLFGKEVLDLPEETLIGTLLMIQFLGLPFTLSMTGLAKRIGAKRTLQASLLFWLGIIVYGYGMETARDFWILGLLVSVVLGVSQALPRSVFAQLIPSHQQGEYFSFFALSGKMTSVLGPTVFAVVKDVTGNARYSILALGVLFLVGFICLSLVSIDRPQRAR